MASLDVRPPVDDPRLLEFALVDPRGPLRDKATGLELTHPSVTSLIAKMALGDGFSPRRVLDPATGFGNFLFEIGDLAESVTDLVGYETDEIAAGVARGRLWPIATRGVRVDIRHQDALTADVPRESFDLVISNPPYVRVHRVGEAASKMRERYVTASGRFDMYFLFLELAAGALAPGGRLAMITSNKFMTTNAGRALRDLLTREFTPVRIVDFRDSSPFKAAVLPVILVLEKAGKPRADSRWVELERVKGIPDPKVPGVGALAVDPVPALVSVPHLGGEPTLARVETYPISDWRPGPQPWHHTSGDDDEVEALVMTGVSTFGKLFSKFSVGIKTTADDVFIAPFDERTASGGLVERELLHPLIRGRTVRRWRVSWDASNGYDRYVLYPHVSSPAGRTEPVDLSKYPLTRAFLEQHRERLASRTYVIEAGREWYEIWVTQKMSTLLTPRKLIFPDFATRSSFALDFTGAFVGSSAAFGVPRSGAEDDDLWYALYLANSPLYDYLHRRHLGTSILAKRLRFWTGHVEKYPLPWPSQRLRTELADAARSAAESLQDPPDYLARSVAAFGLSPSEEARVITTIAAREGRL